LGNNVAAVVLAAGMSRRMVPHNKLLLKGAAGDPMVTRVVDALLASGVSDVWVVVGHQARQVAAALESRAIHLVYAPDYQAGLAASLVRGIAALPANAAACLVCLADMPGVGCDVFNRIVEAYQPRLARPIIVPTFGGRRGNPVLWDRRYFPEILALSGDQGARVLLDRHAMHVFELEVPSPAVLTDFDTPEALADLP
jgi:molybdenum cofactor cytidylyltransferase